MDDNELDLTLRQFYAEVQNKSGEDYSRSALLGFRYTIERHLNGPPFNRGLKLSKNPAFARSNQMLDARLKKLKRDGKEDVNHKPPIEKEDLQKLKSGTVLLPSNPLGLLRNVWFHSSLYWCRRGREGLRSLTKTSFAFQTDGSGRRYATMSHEELTKNHPGGLKDIQSFEKLGRMYESSSTTDGYTSLQKYLSVLHPDCNALFQYPKRNWKPQDSVWFENRPLGVNKIGGMMKEISVEAGLSKRYTNHSIRATAITLWSEAGLPNRQIMAISGHRNESSLRSYNSRPSSEDLRQCSDVLTATISTTERNEVPQSREIVSHTSSNTSNQMIRNVDVGGMFSSCTIQNMQINLR